MTRSPVAAVSVLLVAATAHAGEALVRKTFRATVLRGDRESLAGGLLCEKP